jgi:NAD(P)-dependent dehydrogenase (short-subunit alcohol dehydrogenase family)
LYSASLADFERVVKINVTGTFLCYQHAAKQMVSQGHGGRIVGASSLAGQIGHAGYDAYCTSKFAVRGLTQSVGACIVSCFQSFDDRHVNPAADLAKHGITVNAYAPGIVETPMGLFSLPMLKRT